MIPKSSHHEGFKKPSLLTRLFFPMTSSVLETQQTSPKESKIIGCLPYQILHIASQFASKDESKQLLQIIHLRLEKGLIRIASTDGHRLFRFEFKNELRPGEYGETSIYWLDDEIKELKLDIRAFKKSNLKAEKVIIHNNGFSQVFNKKHRFGVDPVNPVFWKSSIEGTYPNIDQLIPDSFTNEPSAPIAFNASYLADFGKVVGKASNGVIKMFTNHPITPMIFEAACNLEGLEDTKIQYLLMPIQVRH